MKYVLTLLLGLASLSAAACQTGARAAEVKVETVHLRIVGMTCPVGCPPRVQAALSSVPGVESAEVDYERRIATVVGASGLDQRALIAALEKQGFSGSVQ